jgi:chitinase
MIEQVPQKSTYPITAIGMTGIWSVIFATLLLATTACGIVTEKRLERLWSMAYWNGWGPSPVSDIDWRAITHVIHWAALVNADGTIDVTYQNVAPSAPALISAAHVAGKKVLIMISQASSTRQTANLQQVIATKQTVLVNNIMNYVNAYGYDGVDLVLEPFDPQLSGEAMRALATELRKRLGGRLLTAAVNISEYRYWGTAHGPFDRINIMTYDFTGTWNPYSSHNAPLYAPDNAVYSISLAVQRFMAAGIPGAKVGIGIPFYGWLWTGGGVSRPGQTWRTAPGLQQIPYRTLVSRVTPQNYRWDSLGQVPYLSMPSGSSDTDQFLTYDDEKSVMAKVNFAIANHLGGWIIWSLDQDDCPSYPNRHPLLAAVKRGMMGNR